VSVETSVQLPQQPTVGQVTIHPLGGDGMVSPHSVTHFSITSAGDASGGANRIFARFDQRYVQLVSNLLVFIDGAPGDAPVYMSIVENAASRVSVRSPGLALPVSGVPEIQVSWCPHPILIAADAAASASDNPVISVGMGNSNGVSMTVYGHIYNFDRRAREIVPIETLTRALVRPESLT